MDDGPANAADAPLPPSLASRREQMFPKLAPVEIDRLRRFGEIHTWQPGELLFEASKTGPGMQEAKEAVLPFRQKIPYQSIPGKLQADENTQSSIWFVFRHNFATVRPNSTISDGQPEPMSAA